jgi:hypothetical protein
MVTENVYIALIISLEFNNLSSYEPIISLFNTTYPNNKLVIEKYLIQGQISEIENTIDDFVSKYPTGKRVTISITSSILINCSIYITKKNLNILSLSLTASANFIKTLSNVLTYGYFNQYNIMSNFMIYNEYQMKNIKVLYDKNQPNDLLFKDYLEQLKIQAELLGIIVDVSFFEEGKTDYNIKEKSIIQLLSSTENLKNIYITPQFLNNIPKNSFILLQAFNKYIPDIFGNIPCINPLYTNINYTSLSQTVYDVVKNNPDGFDWTIYSFYDILFVLNDFCTNGLEITKNNYVSINPYKNTPPAWSVNNVLDPSTGGSPYGKYEYIFTKDVILGNNESLFLQYYDGGQQQLPDSYSIFKIVGITPNNPSLIEYDDADYYEIYDSTNNLVCVKFNSNLTDFPIGKNMNIGKTVKTRFIYKFNDEGYFTKLDRLFQYNELTPEVNSTMSKKTIKLKYMI